MRGTPTRTTHTRRAVIKAAAAGSAAVGLAAATGVTVASSAASGGAVDGPVVAYVSDARRGEVVVMVGTREIVRKDAALVARLIAIAKEAGDVVAS